MHITPNVIKEYAKARGLRFSEDLPQSFTRYYSESINEYNSETQNYYLIGIELAPYNWYWFKAYIRDINTLESEYLFFEHKYSQNTGKTIKACKTGFNAIEKITNFINN